MKLLQAEVINFGSYDQLSFTFNDQGLSLIYGPTGSGKSTLQDLPAWLLFGITAKDGNVDDIKSWTGTGPTKGTLTVEAVTGIFQIHRVRGSASENDLYLTTADGQVIRGINISETQAIIEQTLGVSKELYIAAAYFNEFSPTTSFFTAKAKDRRELLEYVTDLSLPAAIFLKSADSKKEAKKHLQKLTQNVERVNGSIFQIKKSRLELNTLSQKWDKAHNDLLRSLEHKSHNFDLEKSIKIDQLLEKHSNWYKNRAEMVQLRQDALESLAPELEKAGICSECNQPKGQHIVNKCNTLKNEIERLQDQANPYDKDIEIMKSLQNTYTDKLEDEKTRTNPYLPQLEAVDKELPWLHGQLVDLESQVKETQHRINSLTQLQDLSAVLRAELLKTSVKAVETRTNQYLDDYFEATLRVAFDCSDGDSIDVTISKNGYQCSYKQLSKGQRGLLKLCFSVAIMEAASNQAGVHFDSVFFDEALDGLDSSLKVKAFSLFSKLATKHSSVFLIDHAPEFQSLFDKRFRVSIEGDISTLTEE